MELQEMLEMIASKGYLVSLQYNPTNSVGSWESFIHFKPDVSPMIFVGYGCSDSSPYGAVRHAMKEAGLMLSAK